MDRDAAGNPNAGLELESLIDTDSSSSRGSLLRLIAENERDPELFPAHVVELYEQGRPLKAHAALIKHARREVNLRRRERQRHWAEMLRLWVKVTPGKAPLCLAPKGCGTKVFGQYQEENGYHIATRWFTLVHIPIAPMDSWLVRTTPRGDWLTIGKCPLPPLWRIWQTIVQVMCLIALIAAAVSASLAWQRRQGEMELLIVNGFNEPVVVRVNGQAVPVPGRDSVEFGRIRTHDLTRLSAHWPEARTPFQTLTRRFRGFAGQLLVYNIKNRAALVIEEVVKKPGDDAMTAVVYDPDCLAIIPVPDQIFSQSTKRQSKTSSAKRKWERPTRLRWIAREAEVELQAEALKSEPTGGPAAKQLATAMILAEQGRQPETLAEAEHAVHDRLGSPDAQVRVARDFRAAHPEDPGAHRLYQQCQAAVSLEALITEYEQLLRDHPGSVLYHTLLARILPDKERAKAVYESALTLDPGCTEALEALASYHSREGRFDLALEALMDLVGDDPARLRSRGRELVRCAWVTGRAKLIERWSETMKSVEIERHCPLAGALDLIALAEGRRTAKAAGAEAIQRFAPCHPLSVEDQELLNARYGLAAGDIVHLRDHLNLSHYRRIKRHELLRLSLLLAASPGATAEDIRHGQKALRPRRVRAGPATRLLMAGLSARFAGDRHDRLMAFLLKEPLDPPGPFKLFAGDFDLTNTEAVDAILEHHPPEVQVAGYVGAVALLESAKPPEGPKDSRSAVIKTYRERALARALPDELPLGYRRARSK